LSMITSTGASLPPELFQGKRILVTGATGLFGHGLTNRLVALGASVRAVSRGQRRIALPEVEHLAGSLANPDFAARAVAGMDGLFHCAGLRGSIGIQTARAADMLAGNMLIDFHTLEAARRAEVGRILYVSTVSVYPPLPVYQEDLAWSADPDPGHQYVSWAKRMAEKLIEAHRVQYGFEGATIVRPVNTYGPHDDFNENTALVIPALIRRMLDGEDPFTVWGDGKAIRDFLYIDDCVDGMLLAYARGLGRGPFNLGSGRGYSIGEVVDAIVAASGLSPRIAWDTSRPAGEARKVADITRAHRELGFAPSTTLADGIARTIAWYREARRSGTTLRL
jgi:GDP-L-fucose synthase